jgi:hypothetical protein
LLENTLLGWWHLERSLELEWSTPNSTHYPTEELYLMWFCDLVYLRGGKSVKTYI